MLPNYFYIAPKEDLCAFGALSFLISIREMRKRKKS
jgi:hypothetical protein